MLGFLTQSTWVERIGWVLVHSLWQFALAALAAIVLQRALQRRSAGLRYGVLLVVMAIMVAIPVATWLSSWRADAPAAVVKFGPVEKPEEVSSLQHVSSSECGNDAIPVASLPVESPLEVAAVTQPEARRSEPASIGVTTSWSLRKKRMRTERKRLSRRQDHRAGQQSE